MINTRCQGLIYSCYGTDEIFSSLENFTATLQRELEEARRWLDRNDRSKRRET